ncbi:MAG: hypothetical protein ACR2LY_09530 [Thermoleophilaceae bacterium]
MESTIRERLPAKRAELLVETLCAVTDRRGLPVHDPYVRRPWSPLLWKGEQTGNDRLTGKSAWTLVVAFLSDLEGMSNAELAVEIGLTDHEIRRPIRKRSGRFMVNAEPERCRSRGADRWLKEGRALHAVLGSWPWTHAPDGRLPRDWRERDEFRAPFFAWHKRAYVDAQLQLEANRTGRLGIPSVSAWVGAQRLYESGFPLAEE